MAYLYNKVNKNILDNIEDNFLMIESIIRKREREGGMEQLLDGSSNPIQMRMNLTSRIKNTSKFT